MTDKDYHHKGYGPFYTEVMAPHKDSVTAVLELGILQGGSLKAFRDYFPNATVVGYDIDPATMVKGEHRIVTYPGNVRDKAALRNVARLHGPFDLIVDDASHIPIDIFHALKALWGYLKPGGHYFIEDLDLSRQADVMTTCHIVVGRTAEMHIHPGCQRNGDILVLEKRTND
jgi:demethylmacrocin O-methyltransferase